MKQRHIPTRTCVACRQARPQRELTRLVRTESGVRVDERGREPGRGAYLCRERACWERALGQRGALDRALRTSLSAADRETLGRAAEAIAPAFVPAAAVASGEGEQR